MQKKYALIIMIISILTPYLGTIFFLRTVSSIIFLPIYGLALLLLVFSTIHYIRALDTSIKKFWVSLISVTSVFFYFFGYSYIQGAHDWLFFKIRHDRLNEFVSNIQSYGLIREMNDGQRYFKSINNKLYRKNRYEISKGVNNALLNDVLIEQNIDSLTFESFRSKLIELDFISFDVVSDSVINFTIDGFLDNCYGFSYSLHGKKPYGNTCGSIIYWKKYAANWYLWFTT